MAKKTASKLFQEEVKQQEEPIVDIDLDLSKIRKKRIRINEDNSKILELNISDVGIANRLRVAYDKLNKLMDEVTATIPDSEEEIEDENKIIDALNTIDAEMRVQIDFIFNAPVSEVCGSDGSMWDPIDGSFRYEHIIETLATLYENNLSTEFAKMKSKVDTKLQDHRKAVSKYHK